MPRVKIDYIVSFSSEDPDNQASNLLAWDVSKKKWLCSKGEPSCSVVLQLTKAVKICAVHVGAHHAALVEVLVGRSEKPNEPFQVLVPSSVFLTPAESRRDENVDKVRSFSADQLHSAALEQKWDRVRVVCSQPYNKHCKYGVSFIHIYEPESAAAPAAPPAPAAPAVPAARPAPAAPAVPARLLAIDNLSSDEDDFKPGELFAKHLQKPDSGTSGDTSAQIRQATSQALKNIPDSSIKLTKTPIAKPSKNQTAHTIKEQDRDRQRDSLMYTDDDEQPHAKIDRVVNRHKDEKSRDEVQTPKNKDKHSKDSAHRDKQKNDRKDDKHTPRSKDDPSSSKKQRDESSRKDRDGDRRGRDGPSSKKDDESRKRPHPDKKRNDNGPALRAGPVSSQPHTLLQGVVFVLSGYENPRRAQLRTAALAMGATCEKDWTPRSTHLICAFPNTPKLKLVRSSPGGERAVVVKGEWIEQCSSRRRLLPWQWFATEPASRVAPTEDLNDDNDVESECDTDDEIEAVRQRLKRPRADAAPPAPPPPRRAAPPPSPCKDRANESAMSADSDVAFIKDERFQGNMTVHDSDSDQAQTDEESPPARVRIDPDAALPDFFEGHTFAIDEGLRETEMDVGLLSRYVQAYGGVLVDASVGESDSDVNYVLCAAPPAAARAGAGAAVRADWVWRCHTDKRLYPVDDYLVT